MKLSPEDAALYFKLMWPLLLYVNRQRGILPGVDSVEAYIRRSQDDKFQVRNALYEDIDLLDGFVADNPAQLAADELAVVQSWKRFVAGDFYIERFLKNGAIFIDSIEPPHVYTVLGLTQSIEEILAHFYRPPIMVKTVLLPFKGRIIFDGLFQTYNILFGSGIRGNLREVYMTAKQKGRIIETLDPEPEAQPGKTQRKAARDWRPEIDALVHSADQLKGGQTAIQGEAFGLLKASARLAQAAVHAPDDLDALWSAEKRVHRALQRLATVLNRAEE
jgi:hypothetical protein